MLKQQLTDLILDTLINDEHLRTSSQATFSGHAAWSAFMKNNAENKAYVDANLALFDIGYMEVKYLSVSASSPNASSFGKELQDLMTQHYVSKKALNEGLRAKWLEEFKRNCLSLAKNGAPCVWSSIPSYANEEYMKSVARDLGLECKEENGGFTYSWYDKEAYERLQSGVLFSK